MKTFESLKKLTAMIVFAVLLYNCSPNSDSTPATFPSDGLIAQYNFDGDANDSSGHDLNGTVHGATLTTDKNNKTHRAYDFDFSNASFGNQNDEIYIPYSPLMNVNNITVSLWLYPRSYFWNGNTNNPYSTIINRFQYGYSNPNGQVWGITFNPTSVTAFIVGTNGTGSANAVSNQPLTLNKWYHLVMTYNQNQVRLYINGRLAATQNYSSTMNTSGNSGISIGESNQANGYWNHTDGKIDDVAIWDRALTPTEIEALYSIQN
ncbi:Concanavalin A-like lectin/glucanases superfamily protein [Flavobacterium glycines]|uniref:Concanavalin A-like lectin/glucanases superfamily protein n=1 Tax=Flavobacterium glycines TaxID=551990 RepID=A0A1B9DRR9_9FLAO|nr:LamG domain-containing protein [Flavobacterium glycines]OCB72382.1 hypothetical protein FBGL_06945 [Flavobacterium glycines]GEL09857.1 hypothetical protein FGL01_05960 [Flavobacterium glycines]SDI90951.1 Concanavalin A-like lectin/glucanases superfamily protein [Flavobacterium glycines]